MGHMRFRHDSPFEVGPAKVRPIEKHPGQISACQRGPFHIGLVEVGVLQFGVVQFRVRQLRPVHDGSSEVGPGKVRAAQIAALQPGFAQIAASAVVSGARQKGFPVGRHCRLWLLFSCEGSRGRAQEPEGRQDLDAGTGGRPNLRDRSAVHPLPLDPIARPSSPSLWYERKNHKRTISAPNRDASGRLLSGKET